MKTLQTVGAPLVGAHHTARKKGTHKRCPYVFLLLLAACTAGDGEPGPGASPADSQPLNQIQTRATGEYGEITAGTLTLTLTDDPQPPATYTYTPADGTWTSLAPLSVGTGTYPASARATITYNYNDSYFGDFDIPVPMTWSGTLATTHTPGTPEAGMAGHITLHPGTAALHVTLHGSFGEGILTSNSYPGAGYHIIPGSTVGYDAGTWPYLHEWLRWVYPAQPQSPPVFEPQTIRKGETLFTILPSDTPESPYAGKKYIFALPTDLTLQAGERHKFNIRLDPGAATATLLSATIEPFNPNPGQEPQYAPAPGAIYNEQHLRQFASEWNAIPYDNNDPDNPAHLDARNQVLARWADANGVIRLKADIYMTDEPFEPIGIPYITSTSRYFDATFHGEGHIITGLKTTPDAYFSGLFGYIVGGNVYALHLRQADITGTNFVGGIAGVIDTGCRVAGCSFRGKVTATESGYAGGIAGMGGSPIAGCYADITTLSATSKGGIAGYLGGGALYGSHWKHSASLNACGITGIGTVSNCVQITGNPTANHIKQMNDALNAHAPNLSAQYAWENGGSAGPILRERQTNNNP